ncbi:MAG: 4'-phosphopantetheinyl transferase superfamily protein [Bacteroidota bacterium]
MHPGINSNNSIFGLTSNEIHLWQIPLDAQIDEVETYFNILSSDERERAQKFHFKKDRNCFVITRGVLRILSAKYVSKKPMEISFGLEEYGKPKLEHRTSLNFNVSHSGNMALIGFVHNHAVGLDVEYIKRDIDVLDIAQNFFSKNEIEALNAIELNKQYEAFYRCWTRKEAFIKAEGSGLSFPLDRFSVSMEKDDEASLYWVDWNSYEKEKWDIFSFKPNEDYIAAVTVKAKGYSLRKFEWDKDGVGTEL